LNKIMIYFCFNQKNSEKIENVANCVKI